MSKNLRICLMVLCIILFIASAICVCVTTPIQGFDLNLFGIIMGIVAVGGFFACIFCYLP